MQKTMYLAAGVLAFAFTGATSACQQHTLSAANSTATAALTPTPESPQNPEDAMPRVRVEEAKQQVADGKAVIIDVRGAESYKLAHIEGALDIQLPDLEKGEFKGIPKDKRIIAYCT